MSSHVEAPLPHRARCGSLRRTLSSGCGINPRCQVIVDDDRLRRPSASGPRHARVDRVTRWIPNRSDTASATHRHYHAAAQASAFFFRHHVNQLFVGGASGPRSRARGGGVGSRQALHQVMKHVAVAIGGSRAPHRGVIIAGSAR